MKRLISAFLAMMLLISTATADQAQVKTPGGPLNMREEPSAKSRLVKQLKNGSLITLVEEDSDGWTKVRSGEKEGYVMTQYLNMTVTAVGKTLYADASDDLYLRQKKSDNAKLVAHLSCTTPLLVLEVEDEWAKVSATNADGETCEGWIHTQRIADQYTEIPPRYEVINEMGVLRSRQKIYWTPNKNGEVAVTLNKGEKVQVLVIDGDWCKVQVDNIYRGYVDVSAIALTGESIEKDVNHLENFTAVYYTCTVPSGTLEVYVEPTSDLSNTRATLTIDPAETLKMVRRGQSSHGETWAQVVYDGTVYWALASSLSISSETQTMYYPETIERFTQGVVYAKEGGTPVYAAGSKYSKKLGTVPAGTELAAGFREDCISIVYNGQIAYVMYEDVVTGLADVMDWDNQWYFWQHMDDPAPEPTATPVPLPDESEYITADVARKKADAALEQKYAGFSAKGLTVKHDRMLSKRGSETPVYEFAYYKGEKYQYNALVDALNGAVLYTADYTDFGKAPSTTTAKPTATSVPGEITASQARSIADDALRANYGSFDDFSYDVQRSRFDSMPNYDEPVYRLNYYAGETFAYTCIVGARSSHVLYHTDVWQSANTEIEYVTPTPVPDYSGNERISQAAARSIADAALAGKYPDFSGATFSSVSVRLSEEGFGFEPPYYQFDYYVNDVYAFSCIVHAITEKVLYTWGDLPGETNG